MADIAKLIERIDETFKTSRYYEGDRTITEITDALDDLLDDPNMMPVTPVMFDYIQGLLVEIAELEDIVGKYPRTR